MTKGSQALGSYGEALVERWYVARGFTVCERRWRTRNGEIDLILSRPGLVVFCEVKTRSGPRYGTPAEAVTPAKQARLRRLAIEYLASAADRARGDLRFDVACVAAGRVEVIEAAF